MTEQRVLGIGVCLLLVLLVVSVWFTGRQTWLQVAFVAVLATTVVVALALRFTGRR
jgi:membrane protein YdbS with pleckstrin-like domain